MKKFKIVLKVLGWGFLVYAIIAISISIVVNIADAPRRPIKESIKLTQQLCPMNLPENMGRLTNIAFEEVEEGLFPKANVVYYVEYYNELTNNIMQLTDKDRVAEFVFLVNSIFDRDPRDILAKQEVNLIKTMGIANVGLVFDFYQPDKGHNRIELSGSEIRQISTKERISPALALEKIQSMLGGKYPITIDKGVIIKGIYSDRNALVYHIQLSKGELSRAEIDMIMNKMDEHAFKTFCKDAFIGDYMSTLAKSSSIVFCIKLEDMYTREIRETYIDRQSIHLPRITPISDLYKYSLQ